MQPSIRNRPWIVYLLACSAISASIAWPTQHADLTERDALTSDDPSPSTRTNLTLTPWPKQSYSLTLKKNYRLYVVSVKPFTKDPPPSIPDLQAFIHDFSLNLLDNSPPPALAPRRAGQYRYDATSLTKWDIEEYVTVLSTLAPTEIVVAAVERLKLEIQKHGPPAEFGALISGTGRATYNILKLEITSFGVEDWEKGATVKSNAITHTTS
ncbi:MAG: hypothetical protein Q9219_006051 [cf. Caloplaca sp. 3 TL-2023]